MADLNRDQIVNAIYKGIKEDIGVTHANKRFRATLLLTFAAIDAMAFLNMPASQSDVMGTDFVKWAERYLKFPGQEQLRGIELYGARCGLLHTYTSESRLSRQGKCRQLMFANDLPGSPVQETKQPDYIIVSIAALKTALFDGIDLFINDLLASPAKTGLVKPRLNKMLILIEDLPGEHLRQMLK